MKTKHEIIMSMCYTYRHDYGIEKMPGDPMGAGTTEKERMAIYDTMVQIFENDILPVMEFKEKT